MTKVGDSKKASGAKDRTMKVDKDRVLQLIETLKFAIAGCTAFKEIESRIENGEGIPETVIKMADQLAREIPKALALELVCWGNSVGELEMDLLEFEVLYHWIQQVNEDDDEDDEDE
jgi:hypothetical protein